MVKNIFISIMLLSWGVLLSCSKDRFPFDRTNLTYEGKLIYNDEFRINGLYYHYFYQDGIMYQDRVWITYFYIDGTYCRYDVHPSEFLNLPVGDFIDIPNGIRKRPYCWGVYIIEGNTIKVQTYNPSRGKKFKVEENWATIQNDTTIHFFKRILPDKTEVALDEMLYFRNTLLKPDSTNVLMKYKRNLPAF